MQATEFKKTYSDEYSLSVITFANENGDSYELYVSRPSSSLMVAGSDTNWEVVPLFSDYLEKWSADDILILADAIREGLLK